MAANWDYAILSKEASSAGGPAALRKMLQRKGGLKTLLAVGVAGAAVTALSHTERGAALLNHAKSYFGFESNDVVNDGETSTVETIEYVEAVLIEEDPEVEEAEEL